MSPAGLFSVTASAHFIMALHAIYRTMRRNPIPEDQRETLSGVPAQKALTPETAVLDPRADEAE